MINNPNAEPGQVPTQQPTTQAVNSDGQVPNEPTNEEIQRQLKELKEARNEAASYRRKLRELEEGAQKAEEIRLKEQGEFKTLAEQRQARIQELEPVEERYTKLAEQVRAQILADIKQWPAEVKAFYPGDEASVEALQDWFARAKPLVAKLTTQAQTQTQTRPAAGNGPNPRPISTGQQQQADIEELRRRARESGKYAF